MLNERAVQLLILLWLFAFIISMIRKSTRKTFLINFIIATIYSSIILFFFAEGREAIQNLIIILTVLYGHSVAMIGYAIRYLLKNHLTD